LEFEAKQADLAYTGLRVGKVKWTNSKPRRGNIVFVDMANGEWDEDSCAAALGEWETCFALGRVTHRAADTTSPSEEDKEFTMECYEPWHATPDGTPLMPLWAHKRVEARLNKPALSTKWEDMCCICRGSPSDSSRWRRTTTSMGGYHQLRR
jgi:hypothetical protein